MFRLILRFRIAAILVAAAITAFFAMQLPDLRLEPDTEAYVPKEHPMRAQWHEIKEHFGVGREILVAVRAQGPDGIFTPEILAGITRLTEDIKSQDYIVADWVKSISDSDAIVGTEEGLEVEPFFEDPPATAEEAAAIRKRVFENPVYLDRLVSHDGAIAAIIVKTQQYEGVHPIVIAERLEKHLQDFHIPGTEILIAGTPAIEAIYGKQMSDDLNHLIPIALMAVVVLLFLCFRTLSWTRLLIRTAAVAVVLTLWDLWQSGAAGQAVLSPWYLANLSLALAMLTVRGVLLPALIVLAAVIWTWGFQAWLGIPIYIAGTLVPPLLLAIGCAYGIHIMERYYDKAREGGTREEIILDVMHELWRPVLLTSLTTIAGFGSLAAGTMTVYQAFGITTAFGIFAATVISMFVLPAALSMLRLPPAAATAEISVVPRTLMSCGRWIEAHRYFVAGAGIVSTCWFLWMATGLRVDYSWVESLAPGTPVLRADRILREQHGGTTPLNIMVDTGRPDGVKDPKLLRAIDTVLAELAKDPKIGDTRSIAEYIKRMNQAMNEDRPEEFRVPDSADMVAQYLLLYSMSGDPGEFDDVVDYDYQSANLSILLRTDQMAVMKGFIDHAELLLDQYVRPLGATATVSGSASMLKTIIELAVESQIYSLATATTLVFIFLTLLFRSVRDALICMIPVFFTGVANFGGMVLFGMPLGPDKAMISAIALGIGIDYAIHLMARFRDLVDEDGLQVNDAIVESMRTTGRAVLYNGAVVVAGFMVLAFSRAPSNASFGQTIAFNMAISCIAALVFLPAALSIVQHRLRFRLLRSRGAKTPAPETESLTAEADPSPAGRS